MNNSWNIVKIKYGFGYYRECYDFIDCFIENIRRIINNFLYYIAPLRINFDEEYESILNDSFNKIKRVYRIDGIFENIYESLLNILKNDEKYIFIGGDHSITYYTVKAMRKYKDFYMIIYDSHPDLFPYNKINQASYLYYLIKEDIIDKDKVIIFGISNPSKEEKEIIKHWNIKYFDVFSFKNNKDKVDEVLENIDYAYLSIDIDSLSKDCAFWKEPLTLDIYDYIYVINKIRGKIISFDIVEFLPKKICKKLVERIILETISIN